MKKIKKYIKNYKVYNHIEKFNITIKFNGEFSYNYPVYTIIKEYNYDKIWYYKYILKSENYGDWKLKTYEEENFLFYNKFYNYNIFPTFNKKGNLYIWFNNYFEEVKKLLLSSKDNSIIKFLKLCEIKYIKKLLK
jgi:hypothetical protein